ncbi:MAG TPA: PaaI family thioesterase [Candidatus Angelobacter sp.]|nr:PaaI family thioesterase [Candidatus Angelobacter sp.]
MTNESTCLALREFMTAAVPYWETLGLELKEVGDGRAVFEAAVRPGHLQNGIVHGGVLASIADSACAVAAVSKIFPANYATTINLQVAYLKPVIAGRFTAEGRCVKAGKSIIFCEASIFDDRRALVCTASSQLIAIPRQTESALKPVQNPAKKT